VKNMEEFSFFSFQVNHFLDDFHLSFYFSSNIEILVLEFFWCCDVLRGFLLPFVVADPFWH